MVNTGITLIIQTVTSEISNFATNLELIFVISGSAELGFHNRWSNLEAEDILAVNRGQDYKLRPNRQCSVCFVSIEPSLIAANCGKYVEIACDSRRETRESYGVLRKKLRQVMLEYLRNDSRASFAYAQKCFDLADYLCREFRNTDSAGAISDIVFEKSDRRIEQIVDYIHNNYREQITLSDLADAFYISESHLSRQMKTTMGIGFREYLCKVRLHHAVEDLTRSDKLVISVANDNGFPGISAFNKAFKDEFGVTPSAFRRVHSQVKMESDTQVKASLRAMLEQMENIQPQESEECVLLQTSVNVHDARACPKPWKTAVSAGSASDLLNPRMQKQLLLLKNDLQFTYVKVWGLFNEDMVVTLNGKNRSYCFNRIDEMLIFLIKNDMKPFLQLGPKPRTRIKRVGDRPFTEVRPNEAILELSIGQWQLMLDNLMSHLIMKFGGQEMESWIFEMWSPCWWDGIWKDWYSDERFAVTYQTIKQYLPSAMVGGCEFTECFHGEQLPQTAQRLRQMKIDPDFISFAAFPYEYHNGSAGPKWLVGKGYFRDLITKIRADMELAGWGDKKLFLTNWNMSISCGNYMNDTVYKGCYLLENVMAAMDQVDMMAYWVVSDIYSEYVDTDQILFGGLGLLTVDGHHKPSFYAMQFLGRLRSQLLEKNENYIISCNQYGNYTIVYQNIAELSYFTYLKNEADLTCEDLKMICEKTKSIRMEISIQNAKNGVYNIRRKKVTEEFGSILDVWNSCGGFDNLDAEDRSYIGGISVPKHSFSRVRVDNGTMNIVIDAAPNEFGIVEIMLVSNQSE